MYLHNPEQNHCKKNPIWQNVPLSEPHGLIKYEQKYESFLLNRFEPFDVN